MIEDPFEKVTTKSSRQRLRGGRGQIQQFWRVGFQPELEGTNEKVVDGIPTVKARVQSIYDDRAFDSLPIFADALEEAGDTDTDILNHFRQRGKHVQGCWALDMILGKE